MFCLKLCAFLWILLNGCDGGAPGPGLVTNFHNLPEAAQTSAKCNNNANATKSKLPAQPFEMQIQLPFMDMELQHDRAVHIIREPEQQLIFVLHGRELFQLFVSEQDKRLTYLGLLASNEQRVQEALGATVISWYDYFLLAVAYEEAVEIFQVSKTNIAKRAAAVKAETGEQGSSPLKFEPIQRLSLPGRYKQMHLMKPSASSAQQAEMEKVVLLIAVNFTKLYGKYKTFEWMSAYFNPIEEITTPAIHTLHVIGTQPKYVISGRSMRTQAKLMLTVYEVQRTSLKLQSRQTITLDARVVHAATYRARNYLIACSMGQKSRCIYFRMSDGQFMVYKKRSNKELAFEKFTAGNNFLVAARQGDILIFNSARLDCFSGFTTNQTDVTDLYAHNNANQESYLLVSYKRPFHTLLRMVQIVMYGSVDATLGNAPANVLEQEELNPLQRHRHQFESTIGRLRSILLQRKTAMDSFRRIVALVKPNQFDLKEPLTLHKEATVGRVQLVGKHLRSPWQLHARLQTLRQLYGHKRPTRSSFGVSSDNAIQSLKVRRLRVKNLIYDGSLLPGYYLDNLTKPLPILTIRTKLTTKVLQAQKLLTRENYKQVRQAAAANYTQHYRQLHVQRINNMSWFEFYDNLFLRERDTKIAGRLILQSAVKVKQLQTTLLNNLVVSQLFNLCQPQVVQSNIYMSRFFANKLSAALVNGLDFAQDIVFRNRESFIKTPVRINQLSVSGDINFAKEQKFERQGDSTVADEQVTSDLQQYYTGRVILNGTLKLRNLLRGSSDRTTFVIGGKNFSKSDLQTEFLLVNTPQKFARPVRFGHAKVSMPSLHTNYLNAHPTEQHLLANGNNEFKQPLYVIFMNASIVGDVICQDYNSKLHDLSLNVVRQAEVANITGVKSFTGPLIIDELMTLHLNDVSVEDLVLKSQLNEHNVFKDAKSFTSIVISEAANVAANLNASLLNNLPLRELLNYDYKLERLQLPYKLKALNVVFHKINGIAFDDVFAKLSIENQKLVLHKELEIRGNVQFDAALTVERINGIDWTEYAADLVYVHENAQLTGQKRFMAELAVTDELQARTINGRNMQEIFDNTLLRYTPQVISGAYSFGELQLSNIDVPLINRMHTSELIDTQSVDVVIEGDLFVPKLFVGGNVTGAFDSVLDLHNVSTGVHALKAKQWRNLVVLGDATWQAATATAAADAHLAYLLKNAVTRTGAQTISGNVQLERPLIGQMVTKNQFPKNIDLQFIAQDALLRNASHVQVIHAPKAFAQMLQFESLQANAQVRVPTLNGIDVARLNASLYRLSSGDVINGQLTFHTPPIIDNLNVTGTINGIRSAEIYQQSEGIMPAVQLKRLVVDNDLAIGTVNGMHLDYLLQNRIPLQGEAMEVFGNLSFQNLILDKQILLRSINDIPIDNFVYRHSRKLQPITGVKHLQGKLLLAGPVHVMHLNGKDLSECYQQSIFTNQNYNIDSLIIDRATFEAGLDLNSNTFGSRQVDESDEADGARARLNTQLLDVAQDMQHRNHTKNFNYLDYARDIEIHWQRRPADVHVVQTLYYMPHSHLSFCERQLLELEVTKQPTEAIYLSNHTTNVLRATHGNLSVKAENYCRMQYRKVLSKVTINCLNVTRNLGIKKFIEAIDFLPLDTLAETYLLLIHTNDPTNSHNEVRILRIDGQQQCNITDWQSLTLGIGHVMRLFRLSSDLSILGTNGLVKHQPAASIYAFDAASQQFKLQQSIHGVYDIIEATSLWPVGHQLLLSCRNCRRISIYTFKSAKETESYEILQMINLSTRIDKLITFTLKSLPDSRYLLVLPAPGQSFYYLFEYSHIQGWLERTNGYFKDVQMAVPLVGADVAASTFVDDDALLLLCNSNKCRLVKAVRQ